MKQVFTQEMHCCGPLDAVPKLTVEVCDGGGGAYIVMHAKHWSFDDSELDRIAARIKAILAEHPTDA